MVVSRPSPQCFVEGCVTLSNQVPGFHMSIPTLAELRSEPNESCHSKEGAIWIIGVVCGLRL